MVQHFWKLPGFLEVASAKPLENLKKPGKMAEKQKKLVQTQESSKNLGNLKKSEEKTQKRRQSRKH